ncbi:SAM-dependent methyltransferase [Pseudomonas nitritireducens]|uniref:SAM-dependent methyltransferase n=1 Tax=Pseudomonas nitroreducens TaxID=46680 RepID=A0A7W7KJE6_PSENT|nr:methyltransferase domain-containing protein [Pseudomonas nitritireducens]MBB4863424.1 SAM-dependent methyltransferase [Pseudomonas nitritireducens]
MSIQSVLHVGCGPSRLGDLPALFQTGEWHEVRLDIDEGVEPDIVASMLNMDFVEDCSVDAVFSSHNIEHLYPHEVRTALSEFLRVLKPEGALILKCPDVLSVAQAIVESGSVDSPLYDCSAGPIAALDILYGHRPSMEAGNLFMAHKTAFTSSSLASELFSVGFRRVVIARDILYGLHVVAYGFAVDDDRIQRDLQGVLPVQEALKETTLYVPQN